MGNGIEEKKAISYNARDRSIDLVGGGMIIYMMFGHIVSWTNLNSSTVYVILDRFLSFFMPWFFFKSGMFYNGKSAQQQWNSRNKFLIPFFVWGVLGILTYHLRDISCLNLTKLIMQPAKTLLTSGTFVGNSALWFLLTLLIVKCLYPLLAANIRNWQIVAATSVLTIGVLIIKAGDILYPEYMYNSILGLLFYTLGFLMREIQYNKKVFVLSAIIYTAIIVFMPSRVSFFHTSLIEGNALLWLIASVAGIVLVNNIGRFIYGFQSCLCQVCSYIGRNSMIFFVSHFILGNLLFFVLKALSLMPDNNWLMFCIYVISFILILPVISKTFQSTRLNVFVGS